MRLTKARYKALTGEEPPEDVGGERKYINEPTEAHGIRFDSKAEARRYEQLRLLEQAGAITDLTVHPRYELLPARTVDGKRKRARRYEGDFGYVEDGRQVVEDVKGAVTQVFSLKADLFRYRYPDIELRVIPAREV